MCARPGACFACVALNDARDTSTMSLSGAQIPDCAAAATGTGLAWLRSCGIGARMAGLLVALALTLPGAAVAAQPKGKQIEPPKLTHPMQVVIVADGRGGCEPNCAEWISAEGDIAPDTPAQFRRVSKALGH